MGWRITWLFGRTASDVCCVLRRAGLKKWHRGCVQVHFKNHWFALYISWSLTVYLSWLGLSRGVSPEEALPKILRRASAYSASRWANDFICWVGRDKDAGFPEVPLFVGRFRILICGGGAAGRESSWITIAVLTGEPPDPRWVFLIMYEQNNETSETVSLRQCEEDLDKVDAYLASWFIFSLASSLLSISYVERNISCSTMIELTRFGARGSELQNRNSSIGSSVAGVDKCSSFTQDVGSQQ